MKAAMQGVRASALSPRAETQFLSGIAFSKMGAPCLASETWVCRMSNPPHRPSKPPLEGARLQPVPLDSRVGDAYLAAAGRSAAANCFLLRSTSSYRGPP